MPFSPYPDDEPAGLVAKEGAGDNAAALSVSEISAALKRVVEDQFGFVRVRGEITGFKRAASGHLYLGLKDENARLDAVMWRGTAGRLNFACEDGLEVIATGKLTTYPGRSNYQLVIERMEVAGEGALLALLAKTKARLEAEGLFAPARKQPIPFLPRTIGVVTSPTGAVIRDILHRLADRFPVRVVVWPVLVQGPGAAAQVAAAVRGFSALGTDGPVPRPDTLIVARGGGAIEDLWSFNEEDVVRAITECTIPVISAVGHETDTTLADFAADLRAPTPTAAAELAVPVRTELAQQIAELALRQRRAVQRPLQLGRERLAARAERLPKPQALLGPYVQRLDGEAERLRRALVDRTQLARGELQRSAARLSLPLVSARLDQARGRLEGLSRLFASLDPDRVLQRGYARVSAADGRTLVDRAAAAAEPMLTLHFRDGELTVGAAGPAPGRAAAKPKPAPTGSAGSQGQLL
ncbi:MAG: exodeoxyribonuclease VII large subunit [Novosphingobium sp.]|uniref:exodeoxyribonuclease VII large subunit n=1 Tax=Novosphingobium sp. TaxID=1874826 RepID=UPI0032BD4DAF